MRRLFFVLLLIAAPAIARPITTGNSDCVPVAHSAAPDVAFTLGSSAGGTIVAPVETGPAVLSATNFDHADIYAGIPLSNYTGQNSENPAVQSVIADSDVYIGQMQVRGESVTLDGRELNTGIISTGCPR